MRRGILIVLFILVIVAAGGLTWWFTQRAAESGELVLHGNVDLRQVQLSFNNSERIAAVLVQEGDRVRKGQLVARSLQELHGDTLELARLGANVSKASVLTEKGDVPKGFGDQPNQHDMLTGSRPDGTAYPDAADHTCNNWTSSTTGTAQLGHFDRTGGGNASWNSAHPSRGCSQEGLVSTGGAGNLYCFAIN